MYYHREVTTIPETGDQKAAYIEEVGLFMESFGLPRMWGRVFGALLVADPPGQTAEQLAETLQASRGSNSTATPMLEQSGLIDRISKPGERKDYFRNRPGAWVEATRKRVTAMTTFRQLAEKGLNIVGSDDPEVLRGLVEMRDYFTYWEKAYPEAIEKWEKEQGGENELSP